MATRLHKALREGCCPLLEQLVVRRFAGSGGGGKTIDWSLVGKKMSRRIRLRRVPQLRKKEDEMMAMMMNGPPPRKLVDDGDEAYPSDYDVEDSGDDDYNYESDESDDAGYYHGYGHFYVVYEEE